MLCFCNNSGPLFIIGSVAVAMLGFGEIGATLYVSHVISALVVGVVMSNYKRQETVKNLYSYVGSKNIDVVGQSMKESVYLTGYVCGFVIFFAVVTGIIKESGIINAVAGRTPCADAVEGLLLGMVEMTNGIAHLANGRLSVSVLCAISFVVGFGGLSVVLQVYGIVKKHNFSMPIFCVAKLLQGVVSAFVTFLIVNFSTLTLPVFAEGSRWSFLNSWANSIKIFYVFGITILFLSIIYRVCRIVR